MEDNKSSVNVRNKNALCYIPLVAFFIYYTEDKKTNELEKHIRYGMVLFVLYAILNVVFGMLALIIYLGVSGFLGYKAYSGEDINLSFIDDFLKNKNNKTIKTENTKKDSSDKDDVLDF